MLDSLPIYHQWNATIKMHVFCSYLALLLYHELEQCLRKAGGHLEWGVIKQDLEALAEVEVMDGPQWYLLWTSLQRVVGKVL